MVHPVAASGSPVATPKVELACYPSALQRRNFVASLNESNEALALRSICCIRLRWFHPAANRMAAICGPYPSADLAGRDDDSGARVLPFRGINGHCRLRDPAYADHRLFP